MRRHMARVTIQLAGLLAVWILWSGVPDWDGEHVPLTLVCGVGSSLGVMAIARRMERRDLGGPPRRFWLGQLTYLPWLVKEIVLANVHVARVILSPRPLPIRPRLLRIRASQRTAVARVAYANSITLTPGTVTLGVRGDEMLVHALDEASAAGLLAGEMDRRVRALEGEG